MIMKNKKGLGKMLSVYWFAILLIVAGAIVYMVSVFYGVPYEVNQIEANILIDKVADCLSEKGELTFALADDLKNNFAQYCRLNIKNGDSNERYFLGMNFYDFGTNSKLDYEISAGNINLKSSFDSLGSGAREIASSKKSFYVLNNKQGPKQELTVEVLSLVSSKK